MDGSLQNDFQTYLPSLLTKADSLIKDIRFLLSSIPNVDRDLAEGLFRQLTSARTIISDIRAEDALSPEEQQQCLQLIDEVYQPLEHFISNRAPEDRPRAYAPHTGKPGRPKLQLDLARAMELHQQGASWKDIGEVMGVSRRALLYHIQEAGLSSARPRHSVMDDDDLDDLVATISIDHPLSGSKILHGLIKGMGYNIPLKRVQDSLKRVDPDGVSLRRRYATRRRVYKVKGSNALWHQDGNEKLKPWGFYIHGCIDGHSRLVIYLVCANNKRSKTVGECFRYAVSQYGWPSRVRGDFGTENNEIERLMVSRWGTLHRAYLRGRSVHNVRIERLWRDIQKDSLEFFRQTFFMLEGLGLLDRDSKIHLTALYLVYQPRIQQSLDETQIAWNHHAMRTEGNKSPLVQYELSRERLLNTGHWTGDPGDDVSQVDDNYGVEEDERLQPPEDELNEDPEAPRSDNFASREEEQAAGIVMTDDEDIAQAREVLHDMDFSRDDGSWGVDMYFEAVMRLSAFYFPDETGNDTA